MKHNNEYEPDAVHWNRARALHTDGDTREHYVGENEFGTGFYAHVQMRNGRAEAVLTPVNRTYEKSKVVAEEKHTNKRKTRWL